MALVVPNTSEADGLNYFLNIAPPDNLILRLYVNDFTPIEADAAGNYTEASGFGYLPITLTPLNWSVVQGAPTQATYPVQTFTFAGGLGQVFGYFVTRALSGRLAWAERFSSGPFTIATAGDQIKITPTLTLD